jgi:lambda family phage tail tape measure protein
MANNVGRLGVVLGLNTAEFVAGIENAGKKLENFANSAAQYSKYAATAMMAMSFAALKLADDISDVAQANDVAIDTVVKLRAALDASGGSADKAGVLLSSFTKFIDTAADGSFEAQKAFKAVGVSLKDIGSMTQEQLLSKVLSGLEKMEDTVTRNARAMDFFSKAAKGVDFTNLNKEIQDNATLAEQQAKAIKDAADAYDAFAKIGSKFNVMLASEIGPTLKTTIQYFGNLKEVFDLVGAAFKVTFQTVAIVGANVIFVVKGIALEIEAMYDFVNNLVTKGLATAIAKNDEYVKRTIQARKELDDFERRIMGSGGDMRTDIYPKVGRPKDGGEQLRNTTVGVDSKLNARLAAEAKMLNESNLAVVNLMKSYEDFGDKIINIKEEERKAMSARADAEQKAAYQANEIIVNLQKRSVLDKEQLDREREIFLLRKDNKNLNNTELEYAQKILEIRNKYADEERNINEQLRQGTQEHNAALERNNELRQRSIEQAKEQLMEIRKQTEGTITQGVQKGFDEYIKNLPSQFEVGRRGFVSLMGSMENAVEQFVRTGKFNFGDFTRSVIMDMMVIQAKASAMNMMRGLGNIFGFGSPSVDLSYGGETFGAVKTSGFADGGDPPVGRASIVGERGPELFVPRTAGTIIPNNQLANAMGGGQTVNYNGPYIANMSAIDTQTGVQFLAKNKQTIWASYQSANRSVPVSR